MYRTTIVNRHSWGFLLFTKICLYMFALRLKKNILHLLAGCVHHKIFNMHVKPVCKFLCLKVEETSKTIELIAILAPPKKTCLSRASL